MNSHVNATTNNNGATTPTHVAQTNGMVNDIEPCRANKIKFDNFLSNLEFTDIFAHSAFMIEK